MTNKAEESIILRVNAQKGTSLNATDWRNIHFAHVFHLKVRHEPLSEVRTLEKEMECIRTVTLRKLSQ